MAALKNYTFVDYATQGYAALVAVLVLLFHNGTVSRWPWIMAAHAAILLLVHLLIRWDDYARRGYGEASAEVISANGWGSSASRLVSLLSFIRHFYPVLLYLWFFSETGWLNRMFFKEYMDPTIIRWEEALFGCQPSTLFMQKLPYLVVSELFYASYFSYYIMITGVGLALYLKNRRHFFYYVSVVSFVFYICYAIYIVLPIIGPRVFFHEIGGYTLPEAVQRFASTDVYPDAVKAGPFFRLMAFLYRVFEAPGAALPSSHVAIALTTVYFSFKYLRPIRYVHLVVAILLCLSTVYCRYHYAIDVLAGVATAAVLAPLGTWLYRKTEPGPAPPEGRRSTPQSSRVGIK